MKLITILVPETAIIESVADPRYLFNVANQYLESRGSQPAFEVKLVGLTRDVHLSDHVFTVRPDILIDEEIRSDLVIIPALSGDLDFALQLNKEFVPWIIDQYRKGAEVASLCIGAFLLASTGLLKGKKCSTHWNSANLFRKMFPEVNLMDGKIITEENGLYSSGGATSYWNLLLYLVEKYTDRDTAIFASKIFAIDLERENQTSFTIFKGQKDHIDDDIKKAQKYIEENYQERITVDQLADMCALGRRNFERRFKRATNNTVIEYIQRVKIEAAKRSLETGRKNVTEAMFDVGYTDNKAFRDVFRKITGITPIEYRNKYTKKPLMAVAS